MEIYSDHGIRITSPGGSLSRKVKEGKFGSPLHKSPSHQNTNGKASMSPSDHKVKMTNGTKGGSAASFSTNTNSVVCLPLVSEGLKLVWTQSDQTKELDIIPELVQAFNIFPYPTSQEVSTLAHICGLPLDKVKVWFMVQRIKYGISWASEDIEETRCKLGDPKRSDENVHEKSKSRKRPGCDDGIEMEENDHTEDLTACSSRKRQKKEPPESEKLSPPTKHLSSSHSPPKNNGHPINNTSTTPLGALPSSPESPQKHGRYKKSKTQLAALRKSFMQENWPSETELLRLQEETGLSRNEIRKWFSDSRYQLRTGRGMPGLMSPVSQKDHQSDSPQPLSLVVEKQPSRGAHGKKAQKGGPRHSQFFQIFLSNTLEAFGEGEVKSETEKSETDAVKEEENVHNNDDEAGSEHDSESLEAEPPVIASSPASTASSQKSSQKTTSKTSKKSPQVSKASGRVRKTKEQLDILKEYFLHCPWPKSEEYTKVVELTSLPRADVIQWFGDTRYAVKNGQLRWVRGVVRDHILAEIALQQPGNSSIDAGGSNGTPKNKGNQKRKSQTNSASKLPKSTSDSSHTHPLELYHQQTGALQEKDLDALCRKSRMSYQQVRDWFASKDSETVDPEPSGADD